jgi:hypothetical protein
MQSAPDGFRAAIDDRLHWFNRKDLSGQAMEQSSHFSVRLYILASPPLSPPPWRSWSHFERRLSNAQFPSMPRSHVGYSETPYRHIFRRKNETPKVEVGRT